MGTLPGFNEPFHSYYDQYSVSVDDFTIPDYYSTYVPDNQDDANCVAVIAPDLSKGATRWTLNGRFIAIGIYRDEGRPTTQRQPSTGLQWVRSGVVLTITDTIKHRLKVGAKVSLWNVNVSEMNDVEVTKVVDAYSFSVRCYLMGASSGSNGAYQPLASTNFYENYRVFRLLPSFKLVTFTQIQDIFAATAPLTDSTLRTMYSVTSSTDVDVPKSKTKSINYDLPSSTVPKSELLHLGRRFDQQYDEDGLPLKLTYQADGIVSPVDNVDRVSKNKQTFLCKPLDNAALNSRLFVYDFYGIDLNDASRGPYHSTENVTRNQSIDGHESNLSVRLNNDGDLVYSSTLHDEFGNLAIGVQSNNALYIRKQILPLEFDAFNRPIKAPLG